MSSTTTENVKKRKIKTVSMKVKLIALERIKCGVKQTQIARELGVGVSTISGWIKGEKKLRSFIDHIDNFEALGRKRVRLSNIDDVDQAVYLWFCEQRSLGISLSGIAIKTKANEIAKKLRGSTFQFEASDGWLFRWQKRHGISQISKENKCISSNSVLPDNNNMIENMILPDVGCNRSNVSTSMEVKFTPVIMDVKTISHSNRFETHPTLMKAIRLHQFGDPSVLQLDSNVPIPTIQSNQVLIKISAVGVNPIDTYIREGKYGAILLPHILGADASGTVEDVGSEVVRVEVGQRVYCFIRSASGTYAEYVAVNEEEVYPLSTKLTFSQGASLGIPYFTAYNALIQVCHAKPGMTVLIHGASGGVGLAAVQLARAHGMEVIGTAGTNEGMQVVNASGAHVVFNHRRSDYIESIKELTANRGIDVILEMMANVNLSNDLEVLADKGKIAIIGNQGKIEFNPSEIILKQAQIQGVLILKCDDEEIKEIGAALEAGIEQGWLQPVVYKEYYLSDATLAHEDVIDNKGAKGNIVLTL